MSVIMIPDAMTNEERVKVDRAVRLMGGVGADTPPTQVAKKPYTPIEEKPWDERLKISLSQIRKGKSISDRVVRTTIIRVLEEKLERIMAEKETDNATF